MKKSLFLLALCSAGGLACAQDVGRVISSTPVYQQVAVPRQVCSTQQVEVQPPKSGAGALMGAIAGGAAGNAVAGRGAGQASATVLGLVGGAILGDRIEGSPEPRVQNIQQCATQSFYENRTVAYNVIYEYAGRQYSVQMPNDPGPTVQLQVTPVGVNNPNPAYTPQAPVVQQTYVPAPVIESRVIYQPYYPRPYYVPPVNLHFGYGYWGHHHWR